MALLWKVRMLGPQLVVKLLGNRPWMVWALKETPACNPVWSSLCFQSTNTWEEAAMLFYFNELCPLPSALLWRVETPSSNSPAPLGLLLWGSSSYKERNSQDWQRLSDSGRMEGAFLVLSSPQHQHKDTLSAACLLGEATRWKSPHSTAPHITAAVSFLRCHWS